MIFIVVKFPVRPEFADQWPELVADFTAGTRAEEGNLFFDWSRSLDDPNTYVVTEGFRDSAAGAVHVKSEHFTAAMDRMPQWISAKPKIIYTELDIDGWNEMAELTPAQ
ncbi:antibiotic biosynthesis monooxygenase [Pseudonocardiaceae bacterium YIM PH 21723]|nr:antibiotic biosynthesis monooxygenase [Pseudonocardiaceae bacterium YIM PH 21723]